MQKINIPTVQDIQLFRKLSSVDACLSLKTYRDNAQNIYAQLPSPTVKDENWRFMQIPDIPWKQLQMHDTYVPRKNLGNGAFICDLRDFNGLEKIKSNGITTVVDAAWNRGYVIYIPKNMCLNQSIDLQNLLPPYHADLLIEKVVIIVEAGAQVQINDVLESTHTNIKTIIRSIDVVIHDNAYLTYVYNQDWEKTVHDISAFNYTLHCNSQLDHNGLITGGMYSDLAMDFCLPHKHAQAKIRGAYILNEKQQLNINTTQNHIASHTQSDLLFKGIIEEAAKSVYRGTIAIQKDAYGCNAEQNNKNILLGDMARAYSIPNLEVLNNDVQCAHGSAVGQLDADQLFYMQGRGLSLQHAQQVLLQGFLQDIFSDKHFFISDKIKMLNSM